MKKLGLMIVGLFLMSSYPVDALLLPQDIFKTSTVAPTATPTKKILLQIVPSIKMEMIPLLNLTASPTLTATPTSQPSLAPTDSPTTDPLTPTEGPTLTPTVTAKPTPTGKMAKENEVAGQEMPDDEDEDKKEGDGLVNVSFSLQEAIIAGLVLAVLVLGWSKFKGNKKKGEKINS